jgi:hypothetical protein
MDTVKSRWMLGVCLGALLWAGCGVKVPPVQPVERWNGQSPWGKDVGYPILVVLQTARGAKDSGYRIVGIDAKAERIAFVMQARTLEEVMRVQGQVRFSALMLVDMAGGFHPFPVVPNTPPPPDPIGHEPPGGLLALERTPTEGLLALERALRVLLKKQDDVLRPMEDFAPGQQ